MGSNVPGAGYQAPPLLSARLDVLIDEVVAELFPDE